MINCYEEEKATEGDEYFKQPHWNLTWQQWGKQWGDVAQPQLEWWFMNMTSDGKKTPDVMLYIAHRDVLL